MISHYVLLYNIFCYIINRFFFFTSEIFVGINIGQRRQRVRSALRTDGYSLGKYILSNILRANLILALGARRSGERSVTLDHVLDSSDLLQCIDVLRIVSQELLVLLQHLYEPVTRTRLELSRIYLSGEFEERSRILAEVVDVEHCLSKKIVDNVT